MDSFIFSQQTEYVDFKTVKADFIFKDATHYEVEAFVSCQFEILEAVDSIFIDAKDIDEISIR